jgi:hypothetical protein
VTSDDYREERSRHNPRRVNLRWHPSGRVEVRQRGGPWEPYAVKAGRRSGEISVEPVDKEPSPGV